MTDISAELDAAIDAFAREIVAQAKGNTYINARLDLKTRILDLHIGAAQPDVLAMTEIKEKQGTNQDAARG